jgi:hypothetical protein
MFHTISVRAGKNYILVNLNSLNVVYVDYSVRLEH